MTPEQRRSNVRLALILASVAVALFVGFMVKSALFGI
ncbi:MAG: cytochrome oxidase small assembly protein [Piscinibacter sp.]|nr:MULTISPECIES: cytochrome oxidase small assembly protein [Piscinibacter]MCW5666970.1 cytochrome oxidase small assembly protein [Piscinibacter sp.]